MPSKDLQAPLLWKIGIVQLSPPGQNYQVEIVGPLGLRKRAIRSAPGPVSKNGQPAGFALVFRRQRPFLANTVRINAPKEFQITHAEFGESESDSQRLEAVALSGYRGVT